MTGKSDENNDAPALVFETGALNLRGRGGMPIALMCPNLQCRALLRVPESARGKRVRCPECGGILIVPKTPSASSGESRRPATADSARAD